MPLWGDKARHTVTWRDTCLKKLLMVKVLKLDPTPFSSKEKALSESLRDWDKVFRSLTEPFPLRKTIVILKFAFLFEYIAVINFTVCKICWSALKENTEHGHSCFAWQFPSPIPVLRPPCWSPSSSSDHSESPGATTVPSHVAIKEQEARTAARAGSG